MTLIFKLIGKDWKISHAIHRRTTRRDASVFPSNVSTNCSMLKIKAARDQSRAALFTFQLNGRPDDSLESSALPSASVGRLIVKVIESGGNRRLHAFVVHFA